MKRLFEHREIKYLDLLDHFVAKAVAEHMLMEEWKFSPNNLNHLKDMILLLMASTGRIKVEQAERFFDQQNGNAIVQMNNSHKFVSGGMSLLTLRLIIDFSESITEFPPIDKRMDQRTINNLCRNLEMTEQTMRLSEAMFQSGLRFYKETSFHEFAEVLERIESFDRTTLNLLPRV